MRPLAMWPLLALLAASLAAQQAPEEEPHFAGAPLSRLELQAMLADAQAAEEAEEPEPFPVTAAGWCALKDRKGETEPPSAPTPAPEAGKEEPAVAAEEPPKPGCDVGVGFALYRWRKLSWVAVLGQETLGTGLAFVPYRPKRGPIPALAVGLVVPYDSEGIYSEPQLAIGATLAFTGRRP